VWTSERRLRSSRVLSVIPCFLGGSVVSLCGARPRGQCVAFGVSILVFVHGLENSVDVEAAAPELSTLSVVLLARVEVSSTRVVRGLGTGVWRWVVWVWVCPLIYLCIGF
jgi:hypothetical protein